MNESSELWQGARPREDHTRIQETTPLAGTGTQRAGETHQSRNAINTEGERHGILDLEDGNPTRNEDEAGNSLDGTGRTARGFMRKVYAVLSLQLLLTVAGTGLCVRNDAVRGAIAHNTWSSYLAVELCVVVLLGLYVFGELRPARTYIFAAWAVVAAGTVGIICASCADREQGVDSITGNNGEYEGPYLSMLDRVKEFLQDTPELVKRQAMDPELQKVVNDLGMAVVRAEGLALVVFLFDILLTFQDVFDIFLTGMGLPIAGLVILLAWQGLREEVGAPHAFPLPQFAALGFAFWFPFNSERMISRMERDNYVAACGDVYVGIIRGTIFVLVNAGEGLVALAACLVDVLGSSCLRGERHWFHGDDDNSDYDSYGEFFGYRDRRGYISSGGFLGRDLTDGSGSSGGGGGGDGDGGYGGISTTTAMGGGSDGGGVGRSSSRGVAAGAAGAVRASQAAGVASVDGAARVADAAGVAGVARAADAAGAAGVAGAFGY